MTTFNTPTCILEFLERVKIKPILPTDWASREEARANINHAEQECRKHKAHAEVAAMKMIFNKRPNEK